MDGNLKTQFASPERSDEVMVNKQARFIDHLPFVHQLVDLIPDAFLILNEHRQIVFCNNSFADAVGIADLNEVYGLRPGEALHCVHA